MVGVCNAMLKTTSTSFCTHDIIYMLRMTVTRNSYYSCMVRSPIGLSNGNTACSL